MPTYTFINKETNESETRYMTIHDRDEYLEQNPHIKQAITAPALADPVRIGVSKTPDGFNELLKHAKKSNLHSTIQTRN